MNVTIPQKLLEKLSPEEQIEYTKELKRQKTDLEAKNILDQKRGLPWYVSAAFDWSGSQKGFLYWRGVHTKLWSAVS